MNLALKLLDYLSGQTKFVTWEQIMISECRKYCLEAIEVAEKLVKLSENGQLSCDDHRSLVFFGILLDSAYKIRQEAEKRLSQLDH